MKFTGDLVINFLLPNCQLPVSTMHVRRHSVTCICLAFVSSGIMGSIVSSLLLIENRFQFSTSVDVDMKQLTFVF